MVIAAELGSTGLWALTVTVIEVGLDNAFFFIPKIIYLYMCLVLLITSNLFLIPNSS